MRENIKLYIDGKLADCDASALILMNYTQDDLRNPAIVRNSYSQSVNLPSSPRNNAIFGAFYRLDKQVIINGFNPLKKAPFSLLNERNEVLASGYCKLDAIERVGITIYAYKVSLYGGLGSFLYALSYNEQGEKRNLASLNYGKTLDFVINADTIGNAWASIEDTEDDKWKIINFAPCYNGLPDDFSADKALIRVVGNTLGIPASHEGQNPHGGYVLAELDRDYSEWQMRDLRSYLQRPVFRAKALIDAICNPANNGGYNVILDSLFFNENNHDYQDTWFTLPLLTANPFSQSQTFNIATDMNGEADDWRSGIAFNTILQGVTSGNITLTPKYESSGTFSNSAIFIAVLSAFDASGRAWVSSAYVFGQSGKDSEGIARARGIVSAQGLPVTDYIYRGGSFSADGTFSAPAVVGFSQLENISYLVAEFYTENTTTLPSGVPVLDMTGSATIVTSAVRSGATITASQLFAGTDSPAHYLLQYCKMFGLNFLQDEARKTISILTDKTFYNGNTIDLSARIDRAKPMNLTPTASKSHWYTMQAETEGAKADEYRKTYGQEYGKVRINTGWEFDAEETDMIEGIRGAVQVLDSGAEYSDVTLIGNTRRYWQSQGYELTYGVGNSAKTLNVDAIRPDAYSSFNPAFDFADAFDKPQFEDADGKGIDGDNVLLYYTGAVNITKGVNVTDDNSEMLLQNDGEPCWLIEGNDVTSLPHFSRFWGENGILTQTLDFALAKELYTPAFSGVGEGVSVFNRYWERYCNDRYDANTKVVTLWVDLRGMNVNAELLRNFYWFDNGLWVLNRIINHAVNSYELTQCEFIKVQSKLNYNG